MPAIASLDLLPVWVAPSHLVRTARLIAEGEHLEIITVLDHGNVLGFVSAADLMAADPNAKVSDLVQPFQAVLDGRQSIRAAAELVANHQIQHAPVTSVDGFLGVISTHELLTALLHEGDSLTGLRWSDYLRDWGQEQLAAGREICVIDFDIPEFGHFNRRFGYVVGDRLLLTIVDCLKAQLYPGLDVLVRHSGDELIIGTIRERQQAGDFAEAALAAAVRAVEGAGLGLLPLTFGLSGGYRTSHRDSTHTGAMVDDLIRLAQRENDEQRERLGKPSFVEQMLIESQPASPSASRVISVLQTSGPDASVTVTLKLPEGVFSGRFGLQETGPGGPPIRDLAPAVASASALAIERANPHVRIEIEDVSAFDQPDGGRLVSVFGKLETSGVEFNLTGSAKIESGFAEGVAEATLLAFLNLNLAPVHG